jgi:hypothetical protein
LALTEFARYESLYGEPVFWFRGLNRLAGHYEETRRVLAEVQRRVEESKSPTLELAQIYLGLGERDRVLEILERAQQPGVSFQPYLWLEYEAFHSDTRFQAVLLKFGLPLP